MKGLIRTISTEYRLFRQPRKIGDTFECNEKMFLVIGIEKFEVRYGKLKVWYTCQNLDERDFISKKKAYKENYQLQVEVKIKYDNEKLSDLYLGSIHLIRGQYYKLTEYTDIKLDGTDLVIRNLARPVHPVDRLEAKSKLVDSRKRKLQLEIF